MSGKENLLPESAAIAPSDYVIIGGTGDLALRKIFPALFYRYLDKQIDEHFRMFAVARKISTKDGFVEKLRPFCQEAIDSQEDGMFAWRYPGKIGNKRNQ